MSCTVETTSKAGLAQLENGSYRVHPERRSDKPAANLTAGRRQRRAELGGTDCSDLIEDADGDNDR